MKKTLIALVALSGLAMADFDTDLSALVSSAGYTKGDSFTMNVTPNQFTWGQGDKALFSITDGTTNYTVGRHNTDGAMKWGWLTLSPTSESIPSSGVLADGEVDGTTTTWTITDATSSGLLAAATQNLTFTSTPATPEPATATLSLPALAGLAARRKRH